MNKPCKVVFDAAAMAEIHRMREAIGGNARIADVLSNALGLYGWALEEIAAGRQVGSFAEGDVVKTIDLKQWERRTGGLYA